jgi:hypothetical protein
MHQSFVQGVRLARCCVIDSVSLFTAQCSGQSLRRAVSSGRRLREVINLWKRLILPSTPTANIIQTLKCVRFLAGLLQQKEARTFFIGPHLWSRPVARCAQPEQKNLRERDGERERTLLQTFRVCPTQTLGEGCCWLGERKHTRRLNYD